MQYIKIIAMMMGLAILSACGGGGSSSSTQAPQQSSSAPVTSVKVQGTITFDFVPHKTQGFGLDYEGLSQKPARGVLVVLLDNADEIIDRTITDNSGSYSFSVNVNTDVKIQARAQLLASDNTSWDVSVTDNTMENALYVMEGSLRSSGNKATQVRDLNARSGWTNGQQTDNRAAAPFAILDPVYDAIQKVQSVDVDAVMPALEFRWSPDNVPVIGDKTKGHIGTSGFNREENAIYLLGAADRDTDEYDPHVIIHEWGHYFEHNLSRMDSLGGLHSLGEKLDPRVAFSEGFGNAIAAIITGDPDYKDSSGQGQASGFVIDIENLKPVRAGWFNEGSVAAIIYDVHDHASDGSDNISLGFAPIYGAMRADGYKETDVFGTIYTFSENLLEQSGVNAAEYQTLLGAQSISSSDAKGAGERNSGSIASALPVYKQAMPDGSVTEICSVDDAGNFNKLGNREFILLDLDIEGRFEIVMSRISGDQERDPDFNIWKEAELIYEAASSTQNEERATTSLTAGRYVIEAYDFYNINGTSSKRGDGCYNLMISATN